MLTKNKFCAGILSICVVLTINAPAQQPNPPSSVATIEVKASAAEAEVGQQVKLTVVAKDAAGNVVNEQPSTYFAGPFDAAAAGDDGVVKLFGPVESSRLVACEHSTSHRGRHRGRQDRLH